MNFRFTRIPQTLRKNAGDMIVAMLQSDPEQRPDVIRLLKFDFLTSHFIPDSLPSSCLTMAPRADQLEGGEHDVGANRKPLLELNDNLGKKTLNLKDTFDYMQYNRMQMIGHAQRSYARTCTI